MSLAFSISSRRSSTDSSGTPDADIEEADAEEEDSDEEPAGAEGISPDLRNSAFSAVWTAA